MWGRDSVKTSEGAACWGSTETDAESHGILLATKIRLMKALVWPVGMHCCE